MRRIDNDLYQPFIWENESKFADRRFVGEELGLAKMYTWYRELQDFEDNSMLLYYNDLPREKQREKFLEHLAEEARELKNKIDQGEPLHKNI